MKAIFFVLFFTSSQLTFSQFESYLDTSKVSSTLFDQLKIFPNPTHEILYFRNGYLITSYHLIDATGTIVKRGEFQPQFISMAELAAGQYYLFVEIQGFYRKFLVVKY